MVKSVFFAGYITASKNNNNNNNNNPESVLDNEKNKLLWDFEIQTDHLLSTRQPDLVTLPNCGLYHPSRPLSKIERKRRDKFLDLGGELKKLWDIKVTVIPILIGTLGTVTKGLVKELKELEIRAQVETDQTTALLGSVRILRKVLAT